jgi:hypothetical protein
MYASGVKRAKKKGRDNENDLEIQAFEKVGKRIYGQRGKSFLFQGCG